MSLMEEERSILDNQLRLPASLEWPMSVDVSLYCYESLYYSSCYGPFIICKLTWLNESPSVCQPGKKGRHETSFSTHEHKWSQIYSSTPSCFHNKINHHWEFPTSSQSTEWVAQSTSRYPIWPKNSLYRCLWNLTPWLWWCSPNRIITVPPRPLQTATTRLQPRPQNGSKKKNGFEGLDITILVLMIGCPPSSPAWGFRAWDRTLAGYTLAYQSSWCFDGNNFEPSAKLSLIRSDL